MPADQSILNQILQFLYTTAHVLGQAILDGIRRILPQAELPADLIDPVGMLAVLTIFVILAGVARKIAWIVVVAGWVLIGIRIALTVFAR
jgi:hypothetical protein